MAHTVSETARKLGISRRTVQRYLAKFPALKTSNGTVALKYFEAAREDVWRAAKGRGRPWRSKPKQPVLIRGKTRLAPGYFRGKTDIERAEIVVAEAERLLNRTYAGHNPFPWIHVMKSIARLAPHRPSAKLKKLADEVQRMRADLEKKMGAFSNPHSSDLG